MLLVVSAETAAWIDPPARQPTQPPLHLQVLSHYCTEESTTRRYNRHVYKEFLKMLLATDLFDRQQCSVGKSLLSHLEPYYKKSYFCYTFKGKT